jgi:hypothetical protein
VTVEQDVGRVQQAAPGPRATAPSQVPVSALRASVPSRGAFGIECDHHYGITTHEFREGQSVAETVYWLIRNAWHTKGLTDDNHTWEVVENETPSWSRVRIIKNDKSPHFALKPWWVDDGAGAHWFSQEYRVATRATIDAEVAGKLHFAANCRARAERQRDTIRGRKERSKQLRYADMAEREAESVKRRWPEYSGEQREGWQARMHEHRVPEQAA